MCLLFYILPYVTSRTFTAIFTGYEWNLNDGPDLEDYEERFGYTNLEKTHLEKITILLNSRNNLNLKSSKDGQ